MMPDDLTISDLEKLPLWELEIEEVKGMNLQAKGREDVNELLAAGWVMLNIYTIRYKDKEVWRERPMAILGRPRGRKLIAKLYS